MAAHREYSEKVQLKKQCDQQILIRQAKKSKTLGATRRRISMYPYPYSE